MPKPSNDNLPLTARFFGRSSATGHFVKSIQSNTLSGRGSERDALPVLAYLVLRTKAQYRDHIEHDMGLSSYRLEQALSHIRLMFPHSSTRIPKGSLPPVTFDPEGIDVDIFEFEKDLDDAPKGATPETKINRYNRALERFREPIAENLFHFTGDPSAPDHNWHWLHTRCAMLRLGCEIACEHLLDWYRENRDVYELDRLAAEVSTRFNPKPDVLLGKIGGARANLSRFSSAFSLQPYGLVPAATHVPTDRREPGDHIESYFQAPVNSVLLDNSTYFSARNMVHNGEISAWNVFNLASFLENLVIADKIYLAPTLLWQPSRQDTLFVEDGPCRAISTQGLDTNQLHALFDRVLRQSYADINDPRALEALGPDRRRDFDKAEADELIRRWRSINDNDARAMLPIHSGQVYFADDASQAVVSKLDGPIRPDAAPHRHVCQFLLRTNLCLELSSELLYQPHSHRLLFATYKAMRMRSVGNAFPSQVIRYAEAEIEHAIEEREQADFAVQTGLFPPREADIPLVLGVVLSRARGPEELFLRTLEIRESMAAANYRSWMRTLLAANPMDYRQRMDLSDHVNRARRLLHDELMAIFESKSPLGLANPVYSISSDVRPAWSTEGSDGNDELSATSLRKNMLLLLELSGERAHFVTLNDLLRRVFGKSLSDEELSKLKNLRDEQSVRVRQFVGQQ